MVEFRGILVTLLLTVLSLKGSSGRHVVITEKRTSRSSSASAYASASSSSSVTTYVKTESSGRASKNKKLPGAKNLVEPQKNVTERIREAILNGNVDEIASILSSETNIADMAQGFKFPKEKRDEYLIITPGRKGDPDVTALKGMAKAAVDSGVIEKLTDVFVHAIYGAGHALKDRCKDIFWPDFETNLCPEEPQSTTIKTVKRNQTVTKTTYGYTKITNASGTYTIHDAPRTETSYFEDSYTTEGIDLDVEEEAVASLEAEEYSVDQDCYTEEDIEVIRNQLLDDFSDKQLMTEIIKTHPKPRDGHRSRSLMLLGGTPVDSWLCADCWKPKFCNKNVYWCPQ